jgi:hypothetical protein
MGPLNLFHPETSRFERSLKELVDQGCLIEIGEGNSQGFRVNLRRKKAAA